MPSDLGLLLFGVSANAVGGIVGGSSWSYSTTKSGTGASSALTLTNYSIGAADTSRVCIVALCFTATFSFNLSTLTIGGVTATIDGSIGSASLNGRVVIAHAVVPTGTTADVAMTFTGTSSSGDIVCALYYGIPAATLVVKNVQTANSIASGAPWTFSAIPISAGGIFVAAQCAPVTSSPTSYSWTSGDTLTKNAEGLGAGSATHYSVGSCVNITTGGTFNFTCDPAGSGSNDGVAVSFGY